ncbi:MAG TPA: peptidyl-prolyl cis-trans isomerase [bacterium]|nr:peptidyl-prolyl cis-trans isomerase [bacterium]
MKKALTLALLCLVAAAGASTTPVSAALDTVYGLYVAKKVDQAHAVLQRLDAEAKTPADRFAVRLELGDFLLDKKADYAGAESVYSGLSAAYPKDKQLPDVLYRLALCEELRENYLDAAKYYEQVATRYSKSTYGSDALDAIERCFRKNYQDRVAFVDSFPITRIEIDDHISRNPTAYEKFDKKQQLLDTMIDNRLLYKAALAGGVARDTSFTSGFEDQRNRAMFQEWYQRTVEDNSAPTEKDMKAAYNKDLATKYTTPEKVHVYQIQVPTKDSADKLRARLVSDTTAKKWDTIAKQASTAPDKAKGGDLGLIARGSLQKPVEDAAFTLKLGDISQPIQVKDGFVIIKVTEKKPKTVRTYADVRSQLTSDMQQQNSTKAYDKAVADLKAHAAITQDTAAIAKGKDTLAVVNGVVIDSSALAARLNMIPPFYRDQFNSPEGKRRILDNLILEKLLIKQTEYQKLWLVNKVVDQILTARSNMLIDAYRKKMTVDKVVLDSATLMADYKAHLADYKEPTKVHAREITAASMARAQQVHDWAVNGKLPVLVQGRALLFPAPMQELATSFSAATANSDSLLGLYALAGAPALLPGKPMTSVGNKNVPDLSQKTKLTGPYLKSGAYALGFDDLSKQDKLYKPALLEVKRISQLDSLLGRPPRSETAKVAPTDSAKLGTYVQLDEALPADFVTGLFKLNAGQTAAPLKTTAGTLLVKVTKKDTAQKTPFEDIAKRFSSSASRWSGGDLYWLARDDKAHDKKVVDAAFILSKGGISPVIKLNDSTYTFVTMVEKKDAFTHPFTEVRPKIDNKLRRAQEKQLYDQLVANLRAKAKIQVLMKESDFETEAAPEEAQPAQPQANPMQVQPAPKPQPAPQPKPSGSDKQK